MLPVSCQGTRVAAKTACESSLWTCTSQFSLISRVTSQGSKLPLVEHNVVYVLLTCTQCSPHSCGLSSQTRCWYWECRTTVESLVPSPRLWFSKAAVPPFLSHPGRQCGCMWRLLSVGIISWFLHESLAKFHHQVVQQRWCHHGTVEHLFLQPTRHGGYVHVQCR